MDKHVVDKDNGLDLARIELFEALSHPNRVRILSALSERPSSFAELKREIGIESSGHLSFHLSKLHDLVHSTPDGKYALTDDGKEALRLTKTISQTVVQVPHSNIRAHGISTLWKLHPTRMIALISVVAIVLLSVEVGIADQQNLSLQSRIDQLNNQILASNAKIAGLDLNISSLTNSIAMWKILAQRFNSTILLKGFTITLPPSASATTVASFDLRYGGYILINGTTTSPYWLVGIEYSINNGTYFPVHTYEFYAGLGNSICLFPIPPHTLISATPISSATVKINERNAHLANDTAMIDVTYFFMPTPFNM